MRDYYKKRWQLFVDEMLAALQGGASFSQVGTSEPHACDNKLAPGFGEAARGWGAELLLSCWCWRVGPGTWGPQARGNHLAATTKGALTAARAVFVLR